MSTLKLEHISNISSSGNDLSIDTSGNVGIGTASPADKMHIYNASGTTVYKAQVNSNSIVGFGILKTGSTNQEWAIADGITANGKLQFYDSTDSAVRMQIDGSGFVGIGPNTPTDSSGFGQALDVNGTNGAALYLRDNTDSKMGVIGQWNEELSIHAKQADGTIKFYINNGNKMTINSSGNVGIGTAAPSTTNSGYDGGTLHVHNTSTGSSIRLTNSTVGTGTSAGMLFSKWNDTHTYITNFDNSAKTVFTQSNSSGTLVTTMTLDGDGNVGIGTISPTSTLDVRGNIRFGPAGTNYAVGEIVPGTAAVGQVTKFRLYNSNEFQFQTYDGSNYNTAIHVDTGARVGIGTVDPTYKLDVGHTSAGNIQARLKSSGDTGYTQGAMIIESSDSTSNPGNRGQGVYYYNVPNARTWYAGTLYNNGNKFGFGYKNTAGLQTDAADTGNARMIIDGDAGNVYFPEIGNRGDMTFPICSISNNGAGNQYLHAQFQGYGGIMFHIHYFGYDYAGTIRQGSAGGYIYNTSGQSGAYAAAMSGNTAAVYQTTTNKIEVVINTGASGTGNRWGSMLFFGGTDTITANGPLALVQYAWDNSTSRYWSS